MWYAYQLLLPAELKEFPEHSQSVEQCGRSRKDLEALHHPEVFKAVTLDDATAAEELSSV
jgi:hypothetical protein